MTDQCLSDDDLLLTRESEDYNTRVAQWSQEDPDLMILLTKMTKSLLQTNGCQSVLVFDLWETDPVQHDLSSLAAVHIMELLFGLAYGVLHQKKLVEALWCVADFGKEMKPPTDLRLVLQRSVAVGSSGVARILLQAPIVSKSSLARWQTGLIAFNAEEKNADVRCPTHGVTTLRQVDVGSNTFKGFWNGNAAVSTSTVTSHL